MTDATDSIKKQPETFSKLLWCFILTPAVILGGITIYSLFVYPNLQTTHDLMSPENICRPVPDNYNICGSSVVDIDKQHSEYRYLILANGDYVLTDCKSNEYPFSQTENRYSCADGIWKEYNHE